MRVLAVDPGTHTGWAYYDTDEGVSSFKGGEIGPKRDVGGELSLAREIYGLIYEWSCDVLVLEDFTLLAPSVRGGWSSDRTGLSSVRVSAMIYALVDSLVTVEWAMPGKMAVITSARLRNYGFWVVGSEHARDAAKHLLVYLRSLGLAPDPS